jgi:hypothetical protein
MSFREVGHPWSVRAEKPTSWELPFGIKRFGLARFTWGGNNAPSQSDRDAYLLVLLADQELAAGRHAEARSLLDAAYDAFDQRCAS